MRIDSAERKGRKGLWKLWIVWSLVERWAESVRDRHFGFLRPPQFDRARLRRDLPLVVGVIVFAFVWVGRDPRNPWSLDFDYLWTAGNAVWHGVDPYLEVHRAVRRGELGWPFYYPGTAALFMAPFGALPKRVAVSLFTALGMALLVASVDGWRRWIVVSAPAIEALLLGQWSPWLTAAVGLPWLGGVWAAKPSIGLAMLVGWPSRRVVVTGALLVALSLVILPHWPADWLEVVRHTTQYKAPVQRLGGALLLLSFLRWRLPEARMIGLLALTPHTTNVYEQLPLFLIPQTKRSFALLLALSYLATALVYIRYPFEGPPSVILDARWPYFLVLVYLPALWMVLRRRREA